MTLTPERRNLLYKILAAVAPLLAAYGVVSDQEAALWLTLAGALLGAGGNALAAVHTPTLHILPRGRHHKRA